MSDPFAAETALVVGTAARGIVKPLKRCAKKVYHKVSAKSDNVPLNHTKSRDNSTPKKTKKFLRLLKRSKFHAVDSSSNEDTVIPAAPPNRPAAESSGSASSPTPTPDISSPSGLSTTPPSSPAGSTTPPPPDSPRSQSSSRLSSLSPHMKPPFPNFISIPQGPDQSITQELNTWGPIKDIPDSHYIALITRIIQPPTTTTTTAPTTTVTGKTSGSFNAITFLTHQSHPYVIKVPSTGWGPRWTTSRKYILQSEAETMKLIHSRTNGKFPIPEVIAYDTSMGNELGAPYILMRCLGGRPALEVWYDWEEGGEEEELAEDGEGEEGGQKGGSRRYGYDVYPETMFQKRQVREKILKSLARNMKLLAGIEMPRIGMLTLENEEGEENDEENGGKKKNKKKNQVVIGRHVSVHPDTEDVTVRPPYKYAIDFYEEALAKHFPRESRTVEEKGLMKIYQYIIKSAPFSTPCSEDDEEEPESFVPTHADLNLQNILVDPHTCEVTGILDWENAHFVPRCVGYTSLPLVLRADWTPGYTFLPEYDDPYRDFQNLPVGELEYLRRVYAAAMLEDVSEQEQVRDNHRKGQGGVAREDARYTRKSVVYNAVHTSLFPETNLFNGDVRDVVGKLLREVMPFENPERIVCALGEGDWEVGETYIEQGIKMFMDPRS